MLSFNLSDGDFPFEVYADGVIEKGADARWSVAKDEKSVYWLSADIRGKGQIVKSVGKRIQVISNKALEAEIAGYTTTADAEAFMFYENGHSFYQITFPVEKKTWVYNTSINDPDFAWFERKTQTGRHIASTHVFFNGAHY